MTTLVRVTAEIGPRGHAMVGNLFESWGTDQACFWFLGDGNLAPAQNVVLQLNTVVGERANMLYNDSGSSVEKTAHVSGNVFRGVNLKSDLFSAAGVTGNWPGRYRTGWHSNTLIQASDNGASYSSLSWLGEQPGPGELHGSSWAPQAMAWQDDRSGDGANTGGGDYTPGGSSAAGRLAAAQVAYPVDLLGRVIALDGRARAGAVQPL